MHQCFNQVANTPHPGYTMDTSSTLYQLKFPEGNNDLCLDRGTTFSFVLFHQCMLTQKDPWLNRLNIHFYLEEDKSLKITDILCVHGLVSQIRDGPNS